MSSVAASKEAYDETDENELESVRSDGADLPASAQQESAGPSTRAVNDLPMPHILLGAIFETRMQTLLNLFREADPEHYGEGKLVGLLQHVVIKVKSLGWQNAHVHSLMQCCNELHLLCDALDDCRCQKCMWLTTPGQAYEPDELEWRERAQFWMETWDSLQALFDAVLEASDALADDTRLSALTPQCAALSHLLAAAIRILPALEHAALSDVKPNQAWHHSCRTKEEPERCYTTGVPWMHRLSSLRSKLDLGGRDSQSRVAAPALLELQIRHIENYLQNVPDIDDTMSLFVSTGSCTLRGRQLSSNKYFAAAELMGATSTFECIMWEHSEQHCGSTFYKALTLLGETSSSIRKALERFQARAPQFVVEEQPIVQILGALHRSIFVEMNSAGWMLAGVKRAAKQSFILEDRWEARAFYTHLLADILLRSGDLTLLPEALVQTVCFGSPSPDGMESLDCQGSIEGLLQYGANRPTAVECSASMRDLLQWGCSVGRNDCVEWIAKGFNMIQESLMPSASCTFAVELCSQLSRLEPMLHALSSQDASNSSSAAGLISQALQLPVETFMQNQSDSVRRAHEVEPWEALAVKLIGAADVLDSALRRALNRAEQSVAASEPLLGIAHGLLNSLAEGSTRVAEERRVLTLEAASLLLEGINQHHNEAAAVNFLLHADAAPPILVPTFWQENLSIQHEHHANHALGASMSDLCGECIDVIFSVDACKRVTRPLMQGFESLIEGLNDGCENGRASWKHVEARVGEQIHNAFSHMHTEDSSGNPCATLQLDLRRLLAGRDLTGNVMDVSPRWIAMRLEVLQSAHAYLEVMFDSMSFTTCAAVAPGSAPASPRAAVLHATDVKSHHNSQSARIRSLQGLHRLPRRVVPDTNGDPQNPIHADDNRWARKKRTCASSHTPDASSESYRKAVWEAANGATWDACMAHLEALQLNEWKRHFTWVGEVHAQAQRDLKQMHEDKLLDVQKTHIGLKRVSQLDEEKRVYNQAMEELTKAQQTTLLTEIEVWTRHQEATRHKTIERVIHILREQIKYLQWEMDQLRPLLVRHCIIAIVPTKFELNSIHDTEDGNQEVLKQLLDRVSHFSWNQWAGLAQYARPLTALSEFSDTSVREAGSMIILGTLRAYLRGRGLSEEATNLSVSTFREWRQTLHTPFWQIAERVEFNFAPSSSTCAMPLTIDSSEGYVQLKEYMSPMSIDGNVQTNKLTMRPAAARLFWSRKQPLQRALQGASARFQFLLQNGIAKHARMAEATLYAALGNRIVTVKAMLQKYQQQKHMVVGEEGEEKQEVRPLLLEQLIRLSHSFSCIHDALLTALTTFGSFFVAKESSDKNHQNNLNTSQISNVISQCITLLKAGADFGEHVKQAFASAYHSIAGQSVSLVSGSPTKQELAFLFQSVLLSSCAEDLVLTQLETNLQGSRQEIDLAFTDLTIANHDLMRHLNAWLEELNARTVASMNEDVAHSARYRLGGYMFPHNDAAMRTLHAKVENLLPGCIHPSCMANAWNHPRMSDVHIREIAALAALRICSAMRKEKARSQPSSLKTLCHRLEVSLQQRWLCEIDGGLASLIRQGSCSAAAVGAFWNTTRPADPSAVQADEQSSINNECIGDPVSPLSLTQLISVGMQRITMLLDSCESLKEKFQSQDKLLLELRKRSSDAQRLCAWILADPLRLLIDVRCVDGVTPMVTRASVLEKLRQFNISNIPEEDLNDLAATLMAGTQRMKVTELSRRLHNKNAVAKKIADAKKHVPSRGDELRPTCSSQESNREERWKSDFKLSHHQVAVWTVAQMQTHVAEMSSCVLQILQLIRRVLDVRSTFGMGSVQDTHGLLPPDQRDLDHFCNDVEGKMGKLDLPHLQECVQEWTDFLNGNATIRRGGGFYMGSPAIWQSHLRRRKQHQKDLEERESVHSAHARTRLIPRARQGRQAEWSNNVDMATRPSLKSGVSVPPQEDWQRKHSEYFVIKHEITELALPEGCTIEVGVEYCTAVRPSRNGSLRGSSEAYVKHWQNLRSFVEQMLPGAGMQLAFCVNCNELKKFDTRTVDVMKAFYHLQSLQDETLMRPFEPRIGAFEVSMFLTAVGEDGPKSYGPLLVFSKLASGHWPSHDKMAKRFRGHAEVLIKEHLRERDVELHSAAEADSCSADSERHTPRSWSNVLRLIEQLDPLFIPEEHELIVRCEHCTAKRPSAYGHLRGSSQTYVTYAEYLAQVLERWITEARLLVNCDPERVETSWASNSRGCDNMQAAFEISFPIPQATMKTPGHHERSSADGGRSRQGHDALVKAPATENVDQRNSFTPRVGAFEVEVILLGPSPGARYGPLQVYSKLSAGRFPSLDKLLVKLHDGAAQCIKLAQQPGCSAYHSNVKILEDDIA